MIESLDKSKKSLSYQIVVDKIPEPICEVFPDKNGNISINYHNKYAYEYRIYLITHTSGKFYIGSSNSVSYRIFAHSKGIFKKSHSNKMINELCKNDSLDSFKFYIIDLPDFKVLGKIYNKDFDDITKDKYTRELEVVYITEYLKVFDKSLCCNSSLFVGNYARKAKIYKKNNTNDFTRKKFSNEQILDIIKMYNIEKKSLSEICIKYKCSNGPDIKWFSTSPSFFLQGVAYQLTQIGASLQPVNVPPKVWGPRTDNSLTTKHMAGIIDSIYKFLPEIMNQLRRKVKRSHHYQR